MLVDDHEIMREGLRLILSGQEDVEVVGEAANGREAVALVARILPDVVVMDIGMPELNGVEATHAIRSAHPEVRVLALSAMSDRRYVVRILEAGASGYLVKSSAGDELVRAITAVSNGRKFLSAEVADVVIDSYLGNVPKAASTLSLLAAREREVLQALAEGSSSKEIAQQLGISVRTVETHRSNIMGKLDLHSIAMLTKYAIREGLVQIDN